MKKPVPLLEGLQGNLRARTILCSKGIYIPWKRIYPRVVPLLYITFKERTISCKRNYLFGYLDVHYFQINKESTCKGVPIWIHWYYFQREDNPLQKKLTPCPKVVLIWRFHCYTWEDNIGYYPLSWSEVPLMVAIHVFSGLKYEQGSLSKLYLTTIAFLDKLPTKSIYM